jgi:hypothetical protein
MTAATVEIKYGAATWTGALPLASQSPDLRFSVLDAQNVPGVPGFNGDAWITVQSQVGDDLIERVTVFVTTQDPLATIQVAQPWQVKVSGISWPDGLARKLDYETSMQVYVTYADPGTEDYAFLLTPIEAHAQWAASQLSVSQLAIGNVSQLPATTNGFSVTGIAMSHVAAVGVDPTHVSTRLELESPLPNPARETSLLRWSMPAAGDAKLGIYDVNGRRVAQLVSGRVAAGVHATSWNLADANGERVAPGIYFVRFASGAHERSTRLVVLD